MSDKSTYLKAFNTHFFEFVDDVITIFPENKDLTAAKKSFEMIKTMRVSAIIKSWHKFVYLPYKDIIEAGDISFFFDKDYSKDLSHLNNSENIMSVIDSFREPVRQMNDTNKAHSMKYLQNLSKLSALYSL
jgi:hypothetical protein